MSVTCKNNNLTNLNVNNLYKLTDLDCRNNQLSSLDLSENTALSYLNCNDNKLSNIDLSTVWKEHEERQKKSSYNIMTSIFSHIPVEEETPRTHEIALIHNDQDRILAYGDIKNVNNFSVITASLLENNTYY